MNDFKIINRYPVLVRVKAASRDAIVLKFAGAQYFDLDTDLNVLTIHGHNLSAFVTMISEEHLNFPTVVVDNISELTFYSGNMDESPDWGDWMSRFGLPFEKYESSLVAKDPEDWEKQTLYWISDAVRSKLNQTEIDPVFRTWISVRMKELFRKVLMDQPTEERLLALLTRIEQLEDVSFRNIFTRTPDMDNVYSKAIDDAHRNSSN